MVYTAKYGASFYTSGGNDLWLEKIAFVVHLKLALRTAVGWGLDWNEVTVGFIGQGDPVSLLPSIFIQLL